MIIHAHSFTVVQIELFSTHTKVGMGHGTGFFVEFRESVYLVTNYHLVSGYLPGGQEAFHPSGAIPGSIKFDCVLYKPINEIDNKHLDVSITTTLYHKDGRKKWLEHPELGNLCDVVAIELEDLVFKEFEDGFMLKTVSIERELEYDIFPRIMDGVFITGYPLKKEQSLSKYPIYKYGRIASEPDDKQNGERYYVDSKTKPGMSGSPVIRREEVEFKHKEGIMQQVKGRINFIGIYSGRAEIRKDEYQAELGIVWPFKKYLLPIIDR